MKSKLSHYPYARPQYEWDKIRLEETYGEYYEKYNTEEVENPYIYEEKNGVEGEQYYTVVFKNEKKLWSSLSNTATYKTWDEESGSKSQWLGDLFNTETEKTNIKTHDVQADIKGDYFYANRTGNLVAWSYNPSNFNDLPFRKKIMPLQDNAYINDDIFKPHTIDLTKLYKDIGLQRYDYYSHNDYYCIPFQTLAKKEHDLIKKYIEEHEGSIELIGYIDEGSNWKEKLTVKYYYTDTRDNDYMSPYIMVSFYFSMYKIGLEPNGYYFEEYSSIPNFFQEPKSTYKFSALYPNENGEHYGIITYNKGQEEALKENYDLYEKRWNEDFTFEEKGSIDKSYIINKNYLPTTYQHSITPYVGTPDKYLDLDSIIPMYKEYVYGWELKEYEERFDLGKTTSRLVLDKVLDCILIDNPKNIVIDDYFYEYHNEDSDLKYLNNNLEFNIGDTFYKRPREFGYKMGHYDEMEIIKYIFNDKNDYLPHEDIIDDENLILQRYMDLAFTIANQLELGPNDLLSNISYTKTINDGDSIDFTTIASASITAQLNYPVEEANKLIGQNFTYLLDYGDDEWRNMGLFTIDEAESIDAYTSRITGHDHMYRLNKYVDDFIANYTYPTTLKKFWYDLLDYCNIFYDKEELSGVNADLELNRNFEAVKTSALQIAEYITQLMAGYAHINKDNFSATISHYDSVPASVMPSNYTDINYSSYESQVPNQIKMGYNNDKTVSTSTPIIREYENEVPCVVVDNTEYREAVDSITYRYPDGVEITFSDDNEIKRTYYIDHMDYAPISYDGGHPYSSETFGIVVAPGEEDSRLYILTEIMPYYDAVDLVQRYENGEEVPQIKARYSSQNNNHQTVYSEYIDNDGRLFAIFYRNEKYNYFIDIYDKPEDLEEVSRETHQEVIEYHYDFKVKDYTYTVNGKPLEEINEEVDSGKYLIYINQGHATAKEYGKRQDTEFIPYYITDNALITYNIDETKCKVIMANICEVLKKLPLDYRKCDLSMLTPTANYEIKIGDIIEATNKLGKKFKMMVMEISIDSSGITYKSFGEAQYPVEGESINSQIIYLEDLQGQISEIRGDNQETKQEIVDITATQTELINAVNGLNEEVIDLGANLTAFDEKYQNITNQISAEHDTDIVEVYEAIDAKAEEVKGYADSRDAETLKDAKKYTDDKTYDASAITTGILADARIPQRIWDFMNAFDGSVIVKHTHHENGALTPRDNYPWDELWVGDTTQLTGLLFKCGYTGNKNMNITVRAGGVDILTRTLQ